MSSFTYGQASDAHWIDFGYLLVSFHHWIDSGNWVCILAATGRPGRSGRSALYQVTLKRYPCSRRNPSLRCRCYCCDWPDFGSRAAFGNRTRPIFSCRAVCGCSRVGRRHPWWVIVGSRCQCTTNRQGIPKIPVNSGWDWVDFGRLTALNPSLGYYWSDIGQTRMARLAAAVLRLRPLLARYWT